MILPVESINGPNYGKWVVRPVLNPFYEELQKDIGRAVVMGDGARSDRAKYSQAVKKRLKIQPCLGLLNLVICTRLKFFGVLSRLGSTGNSLQ